MPKEFVKVEFGEKIRGYTPRTSENVSINVSTSWRAGRWGS